MDRFLSTNNYCKYSTSRQINVNDFISNDSDMLAGFYVAPTQKKSYGDFLASLSELKLHFLALHQPPE
jgi:hypothetical protein